MQADTGRRFLLLVSFLYVNSLPHDKILVWSNLKKFVDDKIKVVQMMKFDLDWFENIVGKEENACYKYFLLLVTSIFFFSYIVFKSFCLGVVKIQDHVVKG